MFNFQTWEYVWQFLINGFVMTVDTSPEVFICFGTLILIVYLVTLAWLQPYADFSDQVSQEMCIIFLLIVLQVRLCLVSSDSSSDMFVSSAAALLHAEFVCPVAYILLVIGLDTLGAAFAGSCI